MSIHNEPIDGIFESDPYPVLMAELWDITKLSTETGGTTLRNSSLYAAYSGLRTFIMETRGIDGDEFARLWKRASKELAVARLEAWVVDPTDFDAKA